MLTSIATIIVTEVVGEQAIINVEEVMILGIIIIEDIMMAAGQNDILAQEKIETYTVTTVVIKEVGTEAGEIVVEDINSKTYRSISICFPTYT